MAQVLAVALGVEAPSAELLAALAAHDERMEAYLDTHKVVIAVESTEGNSKLEQVRVNGKLKTTVLEAKDLEAEKERAQKRDQENKRTESPFAKRNQGKYTFTVAGKQGELLHVVFAPVDASAEGALVGQAVVDPQAGELVKLDLKLAKLPTFVDQLDMQMKYDAKTSAGRALSVFVLQGKGGLPLFKKEGGATMRFSYAEGEK